MKKFTRQQFEALCTAMAIGYGVETVEKQFAVEASIEQRLQDKIVEQSTFLPKINVITVDELQGQNILGSASGSVTGRTDTSGDAERVPSNLLGLEPLSYKLEPTESDVYLTYKTMDTWAKFPDLRERYTRYVQAQIANDRELIGWYGESVAVNTDRVANPLLQDVNKGWMQLMREQKPANILTQGAVVNEIHIGAGGDYANLDEAVEDLKIGIPKHLRKDLVALVGDELIAKERAALVKAVGQTPTEKTAMEAAMGTLGGLPWDTPSNFPGRGLVVTSFDNLSIYVQSESWRRHIKDKPEKNRVEDFNSRNEGYMIENPEKFTALEFKNVKLPDGADGWA